jgi:hypothetical protein
MHRWVRLKLETAYRVSTYGRQYPTGVAEVDAQFGVLDRLIEDVERLELEATRCAAARQGTVRARDALRAELWEFELRSITDIAAVASRTVRGIAGRFTLPPFRIGDRAFAIAARRLAQEAIVERETLLLHGLSPTVPLALLEQLTEWQALGRVALESRLRHVAARAGVRDRADAMLRQITLLDGLVRWHWRTDPARLAAWQSARKVRWPVPQRGVGEERLGSRE